MNTISNTIAQLQAGWHSLSDHDRARAVAPIIRAGVSRRQLAGSLGIAEGSIRNLLLVLEADPGDLLSFREGQISKNELIRRVRGISKRPEPGSTPPKNESRRAEPEVHPKTENHGITDPSRGCDEILCWISEDPVRNAYAAEILDEACAALVGAEERGRLPRDRAPAGMPVSEIIRRCRPDPQQFDMEVAWFGRWLALSAFHIIPSNAIRRDALNMAMERLAKTTDVRSFGELAPQS